MRSSIKTDISLTNLSKLIVSTLQYTDMKQQIRKVKYPTYAFSRAQQLSDKINSFKNQKVRRKLQQNLGSLNSYRKVRGDGNCFFRALGFSYFCSLNTLKYNNCFEMINQINLACCYHDSIPKDFQKFYDHQFFVSILKSDWQSTYQNCEKQAKGNKKKALLKLFDQNPYLDFIVVLYFRAVCLKALYKYNQQFVNFMAGGEQASIRTYSEETEGISINLCSKILNITIFVFEVRKQQVHSYLYDVSKIMRNPPKIFLLFSQSHYDIIEFNEDIKAEQSVLKKKESYYQEVNEKMFFGQCIECRTNNYVYEVSNLCPKCHQFSLTSLNDFRKDSFVRGKCSQCWYVKDDISTSFGLCRRCIQIQNQASQRRKQDQMRRQCISCSRYQNVDEQTGLCSQCLNNQMRAMNNLQSSKKAQRPSQQIDNDSIRQSNNSARFIPPNKATIRNQNILQSTIEQLNKNAQNQLNLQQNQKPPNNSTINLGHENYTCKVCKNYQIKGLINGYCKKCAQKYDK